MTAKPTLVGRPLSADDERAERLPVTDTCRQRLNSGSGSPSAPEPRSVTAITNGRGCRSRSACSFWSDLVTFGDALGPPDRFAHVVAGGGVSVLRSERSAGARPVGFRRTGRTGQGRSGRRLLNPRRTRGGGEPTGLGPLLPRVAKVGCERGGEAELGVGGDDQPGPTVRRRRGAELRADPAQRLLDHPEGVLKIEPAQERLPAQIDVLARQAGGRGPQPDGGAGRDRQPRRCSAVRVRSTGAVTGPSAHSNASVSSHSASPRTDGHSKKSSRKCDATANVSRRTS